MKESLANTQHYKQRFIRLLLEDCYWMG